MTYRNNPPPRYENAARSCASTPPRLPIVLRGSLISDTNDVGSRAASAQTGPDMAQVLSVSELSRPATADDYVPQEDYVQTEGFSRTITEAARFWKLICEGSTASCCAARGLVQVGAMGESPVRPRLGRYGIGQRDSRNMLAGWLDGTPGESSLWRPPRIPRSARHTEQERLCVCAVSRRGAVRHHQESTERQYALREKALALGWSEPAVQIWTGIWASQERRCGRRISRLSLRKSRWARWGSLALEFAAVTLEFGLASIAGALCTHRYAGDDEDGCYNPAESTWTALGLKGTMARPNFICCAGASSVASSISQERSSLFPSGWVLLRRRKPRWSWTLMKKCRGPWLWCFRFFARQVRLCRDAPICEKHVTFPNDPMVGHGMAADLDSRPVAQRVAKHTEKPRLCRDVRLGRYQYRVRSPPRVRCINRCTRSMATGASACKSTIKGNQLGRVHEEQEQLEKNRTNSGR